MNWKNLLLVTMHPSLSPTSKTCQHHFGHWCNSMELIETVLSSEKVNVLNARDFVLNRTRLNMFHLSWVSEPIQYPYGKLKSRMRIVCPRTSFNFQKPKLTLWRHLVEAFLKTNNLPFRSRVRILLRLVFNKLSIYQFVPYSRLYSLTEMFTYLLSRGLLAANDPARFLKPGRNLFQK